MGLGLGTLRRGTDVARGGPDQPAAGALLVDVREPAGHARDREGGREQLLRQADRVEFYTAVLLDAIGLDRTLFSPTFAVARVAGWLAHVAEHARVGKLIRPASRYIGPVPSASAA